MKKLWIALLVLCLSLSFVACGEQNGDTWESSSQSTGSDAETSDTVESATQTVDSSDASEEEPEETGSAETTSDHWTNNY